LRALRALGVAFLAASLPCMGAAAAPSAQGTPSVEEMRARYESAAEFLFWDLEKRVPGLYVEPHWQDEGRRFWYRHGEVAYQVDPARGTHVALSDVPGEADKVDEGRERAAGPARPDLNTSPDGRWSMAVKGGNLFAAFSGSQVSTRGETASAGNAEKQLTSDGSADYAYALSPDSDLEHLKRRLAGQPESPQGLWSPDGRRFLTYQVDQRDIPTLPMVLSTQRGQEHQLPYAHTPRVPLPGATKVAMARFVVFDAPTGKRVDLEIPPIMMLFGSLPSGGIGWSADGRHVYATQWSRDFRAHTLYQADAATGAARAVVTEKSELPSRQVVDGDDAPIFTRVGSGEEIIVRSVRDGWAHFYLYDARTGKLRNRITSGAWSVRSIEWVDVAKRRLYFTAGGREAGRDPYLRHLYRVGLDGRGLELLTPEKADHEVQFSPSGEYFVDTFSTVAEPPVSVVRSAAGALLARLAPTDNSFVSQRGWVAPRREKLVAADGRTEIWATLFFPPGFDPRGSYPLIEVVYAGPQAAVAPVRYLEDEHPSIPLTRLGFMVAVIDGRGSALRSQAFQDLSYGRGFGDEQIVADHIAAIKQLAQRHPAIDVERLGIYGHSWGGYRSARAMLQFPGFYRAAVSSAGSHDNFIFLFDTDRWFGMPQEDPLSHTLQSNLPLASRLQGDLLLLHGEADEIVHPANTLQLADELIRANRDFEMLLVPGKGHSDLKYTGYVNRRVWDFFTQRLLGRELPTQVSVPDRRVAP
jgi:dipeptidyl-peptidase-4